MLHFTSDQFVQWLGIYFWPMLRIMALISTAPILSEKSVPKRVKIGLGMVITIIVAPSLPAVDIPIFSPECDLDCPATGDDWRGGRVHDAARLRRGTNGG